MTMSAHEPTADPAYKAGAAAFLIAAVVILTALGFEYFGGYAPCPLCLQQRWAYYAALPVLFFALVALSNGQTRLPSLLFFLVALAFLFNSGLGVYQAGAEWKFWPGPEACAGAQSISTDAGGLLDAIKTTAVIRCDEASWRFAGLSFAGWNVVASFMLFALAMRAAFEALVRR